MSTPYNFGPAAPDETLVFGARRPGYRLFPPDDDTVADWTAFVRGRDVDRVCCLLDDALAEYEDLLGDYRAAVGDANVCHAPVRDHAPLPVELFEDEILPFLRAGANADRPTVVHCTAGTGRAGQALVGWLCRARGYDVETALFTVRAGTPATRDPLGTAATGRDHLRALAGE